VRSRCLNIAMVVCAAGLVCASSWAQLPKSPKQKPGGLEGQVVTAKGVPVADAQILWQVADGETPHVLHSDAHGQFHIERLRTGFYDLRASANGAWSEWDHNVLVRPGSDTNVTLRLAFKPPVAPMSTELKGAMRIWDAPVSGSVPRASAIDASGNAWFTLEETGHIARFNPNNEEWKLFKIPTVDSAPVGLVFDNQGEIWFAENNSGKIGHMDPKTGAMSEFTPPTVKDPLSLAIGPDGAVWFTAENSNAIGRLDTHSGIITEFGVPTQNAHPYGIVAAEDHALWFCELSGGKLGRMDPATGTMTEFAPMDPDVKPRRMVAVSGAIYFTDFGGGRLGRITLADKKFKFWDSPSGIHSAPDGIGADAAGKIWYEESGRDANTLVRFDPAVEVFRTYPMPAANSEASGMARDAKGRLWLPLSGANKIAIIE
jgi:virginiamycin B lyase